MPLCLTLVSYAWITPFIHQVEYFGHNLCFLKIRFLSPNSLSRVTLFGVLSQPLTPTRHFCKSVLWLPRGLRPLLLLGSLQFLSLLNKDTTTTKTNTSCKGSSKHMRARCLLKSRGHITYTQIIQTPCPTPQKK